MTYDVLKRPPHYRDELVTLWHGDCLDVLRSMPDASIDAVVTDPPYGLEFMGSEWDGADGFRRSLNAADAGRENVFGRTSRTSPEYRALHTFQEWCEQWSRECLRVLKPGGHMLAFGGSRTWHRLASAVEDAGFEIRDSIAWLYGSGFPKSMDVSKAIDAAAGAAREVIGEGAAYGRGSRGNRSRVEQGYRPTELNPGGGNAQITAPATDDAETWGGWGTALKPAFEPIVVARKPLAGTVAANVLAHGTGALNIAGTRVGETGGTRGVGKPNRLNEVYGDGMGGLKSDPEFSAGRWPTNVVLDESQAEALDDGARRYGDSGGASRFFPTFRYEAKAPTSERPKDGDVQHPTVKPLDLMRWLVRLVTPPDGVVLEPFAGSGTTVEACLLEGFKCIAIEREADYLPLIMRRITKPLQQSLFGDWEDAS